MSSQQYYWGDMWTSYHYPLQYYQIVPVYYLAAPAPAPPNLSSQASTDSVVPTHASAVRYQLPGSGTIQAHASEQFAGGRSHEAAPAATTMIPAMIMCNGSMTTLAPVSSSIENNLDGHYSSPVQIFPQLHQHLQHHHHLHDHFTHHHHHHPDHHHQLFAPQLSATPQTSPVIAFSQPKLGFNLISMLPIDAQPTRTRQAYGMDKVWLDEFEQLFSQFYSNIIWTLLEVETNPSIRDESNSIVGYQGRYLVELPATPPDNHLLLHNEGDEFTRPSTSEEGYDESEEVDGEVGEGESATCNGDEPSCEGACEDECSDACVVDKISGKSEAPVDLDEQKNLKTEEEKKEAEQAESTSECHVDQETISSRSSESDCDSGAQVNSTIGSGTSETCCLEDLSPSEEPNFSCSATANNEIPSSSYSEASTDSAQPSSVDCGSVAAEGVGATGRKFPTRFRMFIDSAKVRFCCDTCGHGWTSMKGRVVFWYELFELVRPNDSSQRQTFSHPNGGNYLIGYCAYKLFGQQCDVCKIENRFERPMWYPEEVTKVLNNLYNKIGQVYFGFKMPAIIKQRRAGKPKTSHNSSLCQACHDGVCTDRK